LLAARWGAQTGTRGLGKHIPRSATTKTQTWGSKRPCPKAHLPDRGAHGAPSVGKGASVPMGSGKAEQGAQEGGRKQPQLLQLLSHYPARTPSLEAETFLPKPGFSVKGLTSAE